MFAYSTISPYYFDYLASIYTREDILNDDGLCHLLENPYTKDNMEMALHWKDAKRGGENEQRRFIEYFLANGPELDPDTILYYREKCLQNPVYVQLAEIVISNIEIDINDIRTNRYGKTVDEDNCFTQPCNYLAPMSSSVGMMGDSNNFLTLSNIFAKLLKKGEDEKENEENKDDKKDSKSTDDKEVGEGTKDEDGDDSVWGHIRQHVVNKIIPSIRISLQGLYDNMKNEMKEFAEKCSEAGLGKHISLGDPVSIDRSEAISAATKMNVMNRMGDCARLWQYMRQYNPYDSEKNTKGPIQDEMLEQNKAPSGTSFDNTPTTSAVKKLSPSGVNSMAAADNKVAQAIKKLQETEWSYTAKDIEFLSDSNKSLAEKEEYIRNKSDDEIRSLNDKWQEMRLKLLNEADEKIAVKLRDEIDKIEERHREISDQYWELANAIKEQREKTEKVIMTEEEFDDLWVSDEDDDDEDDEKPDTSSNNNENANESNQAASGVYVPDAKVRLHQKMIENIQKRRAAEGE